MITICLTATAYGGDLDGLEKSVIDAISYQIYTNSDKPQDFNPTIHESYEIGSLDKYRTFITEERKKNGVLIYTTGELY